MRGADIRQSDEWSEYLKMYGWESRTLLGGNIFRTLKLGPLCFGKLHRPSVVSWNLMGHVEEAAKTSGITSLKVSLLNFADYDLVSEDGFKTCKTLDLPPRTMLIDLTLSEEELWGKLHPNCRKSVKKSLRDLEKIEIVQNPSTGVIKEYFKVLTLRSRRKGYYVQSLEDHVRKVEIFRNRSFVVNAYDRNKELLGTKMFLGFKDTVWYMHAGISNLGQRSQSGYLSIWESIKYFKKLGYKVFDFECLADSRLKNLTKSWSNYTDFKMKFGGEVVSYPLPLLKYYRYLSPLNLKIK